MQSLSWPKVAALVLLLVMTPAAVLAAAVRRLFADSDLDARLRVAGPVRAEAFGWKAAGEALVGAYRDALSIEERAA